MRCWVLSVNFKCEFELFVLLVDATLRSTHCLTPDATVETCVVSSDVRAGMNLVCSDQFTRTRARFAVSPSLAESVCRFGQVLRSHGF